MDVSLVVEVLSTETLSSFEILVEVTGPIPPNLAG